MPSQWISAEKARAILAEVNGIQLAEMAICRMAQMGSLKSRARALSSGGRTSEDAMIPKDFWAEKADVLVEDWASGDFEMWIDQGVRMRALGVEFDFTDLREALEPETAAVVARQLSVAGDPAWMTAMAARRFMHESLGHRFDLAGSLLIEQCQLGFVAAKAVLWQQASVARNADDWEVEEREKDIPPWFWNGFCSTDSSRQDWSSGKFSGRGRSPNGLRTITLSAVHFSRASLEAMLPKKPDEDLAQTESHKDENDSMARSQMPALAEASLIRWWNSKADVRERLSQHEIIILLNAAFPENFIARDRVRQLTGGRKRGPKSISPKSAAK